MHDAVVVGGGPNGLAAAITLARAGRKVVVFERAGRAGGGLRSDALTLPGFLHDVCSSVYPLGAASPFFRSLSLADHGARFVEPPLAYAHPLDEGDAAWASRSVAETALALGGDRAAYQRLFDPIVNAWQGFVADVLSPVVHVPRRPFLLARFGFDAVRSATAVARAHFRTARARALFAGVAAHSVLPLDRPPSASIGLVLGAMAHAVGWPFVQGGAERLAEALVAELAATGGEVVTDHAIETLDDLPVRLGHGNIVMCDLTPRPFLMLAGGRLPDPFRRLLEGYRYGPGVFKVDWALREPIPWRATECRRAGTVHVGGTAEEVAAAELAPWHNQIPARPFVLVTQPTICDSTRAPLGRHTAWGYCHVPHGAAVDMTERIEAQIERFAPGFRDVVLARAVAGPHGLEERNPNLVGGDIGGGAMTFGQLLARPTWRGYRTPLRGLYLCSSATPPGGGVHGMCGYHAARAALRTARR